jgi:hypothetical protein
LTDDAPKKMRINDLPALPDAVNKALKLAMTWLVLPLLLAATPSAPKPATAELVSATVQIVAAEEIRFADLAVEKSASKDPASIGKVTARQTRRRDGMPMVEFY